MNIKIESNFQFVVSAIQYIPSGELRITLQSDAATCGGRYQYTADLGDRSGTTHYYGHYPTEGMDAANPSTLTDDNGNIARWMLCESRDVYDNWVRYHYSIDTVNGTNAGRQIYIDSIAYTGHGNEKGEYRVVFLRRDRSENDRLINGNIGFKEETRKQLCGIAILTGDTAVTGYLFETECNLRTNYKTRLKAVSKIDPVIEEDHVGSQLEDFCAFGDLTGWKGGISRQTFDYYDAPSMDTLFGPEMTSSLPNDNLKSHMMRPRHRIDTVCHATGLGLTQNSSWDVGGTLAMGLGTEVWKTSNSVGGNFHRGGSAGESRLTLIDLDGDGLADKVFLIGDEMYWRRQLQPEDGVIRFGGSMPIEGASHFMVESGTSITGGVQASVGGGESDDLVRLSGSGSWTRSTSTVSVYFTDMDGDGLPDIVNDGQILFNRIVDGQPVFTPYVESPEEEMEQPTTTVADCGGIIFDGAVSDSVAFRRAWIFNDSVCDDLGDTIIAKRLRQSEELGLRVMRIALHPEYHYFCMYRYRPVLDSSQRNLAMDGVPNTEAVRVWVAPDSGLATVRSYVRLLEDDSPEREVSRHADGVTYIIQHSKHVEVSGDTLHSSRDSILMTKAICADCYRDDDFEEGTYDSAHLVYVERGDILFFRLRSNDDCQFDNVEDHILVELNGKHYSSDDGFVLTDSRVFQAPYDGHYKIDGDYSYGAGDFVLNVRQPTPTQYIANYQVLNESGAISKDSVLQLVVHAVPGYSSDWGSVVLHARIRFWSDSLPDTLTVWTTGKRLVEHPSGSVWGWPVYQRLFGPLYKGWGQFAYNPGGATCPPTLIRPGSLKPTTATLISHDGDTTGLRDRIMRPITEPGFQQDNAGAFAEANGTLYTPICDSTCWVQMDPDAIHNSWVAFGAQSVIGKTTMSGSLQRGWYSAVSQVSSDSSANLPPQILFDDAVPAPTNDSPAKAVRKVTRTRTQSYSFGVITAGASYSSGNSSVETDCLDLNGDRYPDMVGTAFVQYRSQWGGMGTVKALPSFMDGASVSETGSTGVSYGASVPNHKRMSSGRPAKALFSLLSDCNAGAGLSFGGDLASGSWIDINGDGLPDFVGGDGHVRLNTGYTFLPAEDWNVDTVRYGQSFSGSANIGVSSIGFTILEDHDNRFQGSIQIGSGLGRSANRMSHTLIDINGDGLPDKVWKKFLETDISQWSDLFHPWDSVHVKLNLGGGRWSQTYDMNIFNFSWSDAFNESLDIAVTLGVTVGGLFKITGGVSSTPYGSGASRDRMQLVDVNGDGLPDLVTSDREGEMTVRYHRGGRTNLLKGVTNFTGSRIRLDYALSAPDRNQPSRSWQLVLVTTKDPLNPNGADTTATRIAYSNPHYDRLERSSYGYGTVIVDQVNPADNTVYRSIRRDFHNENILVKGRPKRELTSDGQGNRYVEKEYQYGYAAYDGGTVDTCSGNAYSLRDRIVTRHFEGTADPKFTTAEAFEYDRYHNVTKYVDEGDTAYNDDGLYVDFTYLTGQAHNLIGLRDSYKVYATGTSGNDWMRSTSLEYWDKGKLKKQIMHNSPATSEFEFWYDSYGNLAKARKPQNDSLQRMEYQYTYDAYTHTYPVKIKDSQGDSVMTSYLLHFGRPTSVVDPTGSTMRYTYDRAGRLLSVTSPLNSSNMPSLTNEFYPVNYYNSGTCLTYGESDHPYAVSAHYDDRGTLITRTVVITDGFGRVIQTKKGITSFGQPMRQVSGREFYDAFGRPTGRHDLFCEVDDNNPGLFNGHLSPLMDTTRYDILDRRTEVRQPLMNFSTSLHYDVQDDLSDRRRFTTSITDPNSHTTVQFADYDGRKVQLTDALGGSTLFQYDALGQLVQSIDPEGFVTMYVYDKLGQLARRVHPDAGTTQYTYDAAGNMTHESNPLGDIFYDYTYQRLARKRYSDIVENNVTYTYGTGGTSQGRLVSIEDGTGRRELEYDALGNVKKESRTVAIPGSDKVCRFTTAYEYDSWGRMLTMTYPDGEVVTYRYAYGGDLESMEGDKGTEHYDYLSGIEYNDYGQRIHVSYGNGATCDYSYDALHRLVGLTSMSSIGEMQNISYTIDGVGNIHNVENYAIALPIGIGGYYLNSHSYDDLDRLTVSSGSGALGNYDFSADYSPSGRLNLKTLNVTMEAVSSDNKYYYGYCSQAKPHAPRRIYDLHSDILTDLQWDGAGNLGQVNSAQHGEYNASRFLFWTEDNRLYTVADDKHHSYYAYDHAGDRTLKFTGTSSLLDINADQMMTSAVLTELTMYPTPYVVATNQGYTKHYYAGSDRVAARIGGGGLEPMEYIQEQTERADWLFTNCRNRITDRELESNVSDCIKGEQTYELELQLPISDIPSGFYSETEVDAQSFVNTMDYFITASDAERDVYFYHSDHLGSASWITDNQGVPVQHLQYLPYGEPFVNQRSTGYNERFTFTGKEKDPETGYSYFGARYLEHDLMTGWLSVDPMSDKYPSLSPYAYCAWNPVKLVDVDGYMIDDYYNLKGELIHHTNEGNSIYLVITDGEKVDKDRTIALPTNSTLTKMEQMFEHNNGHKEKGIAVETDGNSSIIVTGDRTQISRDQWEPAFADVKDRASSVDFLVHLHPADFSILEIGSRDPSDTDRNDGNFYRSKLGAILSFVQRFEFGRTGQSINSKDYDPYISFYNKTSDMAIYSMKFSEFKKTVIKINEKCGRP